jgi:hypothetical protein
MGVVSTIRIKLSIPNTLKNRQLIYLINSNKLFTDAGRHDIDSSQSNFVKKSLSSSIS